MHDSTNFNRRSIRLKDYDYSNEGAYFITICTHNKQCMFGDVIGGEMRLNELGMMVEKALLEITYRFIEIKLDEYRIMPNHVHCIIMIVGATLAVARKRAGTSPAPTIGRIIGAFKSITANAYTESSISNNIELPPKLWQRNFYEHVIRNENDLNDIREYIQNNPMKWHLDEYYYEE